MNNEAYRDLVFEVQALRRLVERDLQLGGALGVAAELWPHQIANVGRVLRDTSVRHILADEVGLGKTVQAIMVMKALLLQRPDLRVCIVVPNHLKDQWAREVMARANLAVTQEEIVEGDDRRPLLLWPESRRAKEEDLSTFDLLIVDELPRLRNDIQERIFKASDFIPHILVLTATPPLDDPDRASKLFGLIEPVRAELAAGDVMASLQEQERIAARLAEDGWPEGQRWPAPPEPVYENAALAFATTRRILRTRRAVWHRYLPIREKHVRVVPPTFAERRRQELLWRWFEYKDQLERNFDLIALAQRVRSPATFRQRVTWLKGHGHDREGLIEAAGKTLDGSPGDSRFEALLDILLDIWEAHPSEQVVIAAGDNKTVEELDKGLSKAFDAMPSGAPLTIASIRNQTAGEKEELFKDDPVAESARRFREGSAQVLLLAEAGAAGLNLQCARHIVLYAVPWDPVEVEQLIGRVDRIGNPATYAEDGTLPIEVHIVAQKGLVDHRVVQVIEATGILEQSLSLDGEAVDLVRTRIAEVGLKDDPTAWPALVDAAKALGRGREAEDLDLPLLGYLPTNPTSAAEFGMRLANMRPCPPTMGKPRENSLGWADANLAWLKSLHKAKRYKFFWEDQGTGIRKISYDLPIHFVRSAADLNTRPIGVLPEPKSGAYLRLHRHNLESEPLLHWNKKENNDKKEKNEQPLYFFDHGSPLHEDLIRVWTHSSKKKKCKIYLPQNHLCAHLADSIVYVCTAQLNASQLLPKPEFAHPELEADTRFLQGVLPSALLMVGVVVRRHSVAPLPIKELTALLAPDIDSPLLQKSADEWVRPNWLTDSLSTNVNALAEKLLNETAAERWSPRWHELEREIEARRYLLSIDATEAEELFALRRDDLSATIKEAESKGQRVAMSNATKRRQELFAKAEARAQLENARDHWLSTVVTRSPKDAIIPFNDAWILIDK